MAAAMFYFNAFQMFAMLEVIVCVGYMFAWRKVFNLTTVYEVLRAMRIISYPALMFREIALSEPSFFTWKPLIISALTFSSVRLLILIFSLIFPLGNEKSRVLRFLQLSFSFGYVNLYTFGYPVTRFLFGEKYEYMIVIMNIVQSLIFRPLDVYLMNKYAPKTAPKIKDSPLDLNNCNEQIISPSTVDENGAVPEIDNGQNETQLEDINDDPKAQLETFLVSKNGDNSSDLVVESEYFTTTEGSMKKRLLFAIFSAQNICIFIGLGYSFMKWGFPVVMETAITNFSRIQFATTLFFVGVAIWSHPFKKCDYKFVVPCLLMKVVVFPLMAALFCWIFKFDQLTAKACVMLFSLPCDYTGLALIPQGNLSPNPITYTFVFSQMIAMPAFMMWAALINEVKIFG